MNGKRTLQRCALVALLGCGVAVSIGACGRSSLWNPPEPFSRDTFGDGSDGPLVVGSSTIAAGACTSLFTTLGSTLTIGSLGPGPVDMVLLWQVQGVAVASGTDDTFSAIGDTGRFELVRAASGTAASLVLARPPQVLFKTSGNHVAQVCRVPEYSDVVIATDGEIVARGWNGAVGTGGIISFLVNGTLLFEGGNARIRASGAGMRGGIGLDGDGGSCVISMPPGPQDLFADGGNPLCAGQKGEGIDPKSFGTSLISRGNRANGAGGGVANDGGGGGGGNGGAGGDGARNQPGIARTEAAGGTALVSDTPRIFLGGGGGAGHSDNAPAPSGGAGGGAIVIFARRIAGNGWIVAGGQAALAPPQPDSGGSGGGAGGTIAVTTSADAYQGVLRAVGGAGTTGVSVGHGPGGGGGGGRIYVRGLSLTTAQYGVGGGPGGVDGNSVPNGATSGSAGIFVVID